MNGGWKKEEKELVGRAIIISLISFLFFLSLSLLTKNSVFAALTIFYLIAFFIIPTAIIFIKSYKS